MEVKLRPKGLGLGADRTVLENAAKALSKPKEGEEKLKVIIGANVQLLSGKHQGLYGQVSYKFIFSCFVFLFLKEMFVFNRFLAWMQTQAVHLCGWLSEVMNWK